MSIKGKERAHTIGPQSDDESGCRVQRKAVWVGIGHGLKAFPARGMRGVSSELRYWPAIQETVDVLGTQFALDFDPWK